MSSFPPPGQEWMEGKTAATVRFVMQAEAALEARAAEDAKLRAAVARMKSGEESLTEFENVDDWLERLRDHHP